jgi:hypothetical protein
VTKIKSLMLAAIAASSLGVGTAMAQQQRQGSATAAPPPHEQSSPVHEQRGWSAIDQRSALCNGWGG